MEKCQQLMALLQSQLGISSPPQIQTPSPENVSAALIHSSTSSSQITPPQFTGTISFTPFVATVTSPPSWLIDTGATHHVCYNLSLFDSYSPVNDAFVNLTIGGTVVVTHIGNIQLTPSLTLSSVLCVPSFASNLISAP